MTEPLTKVDSAVQGLSSSPPKEKGHRRASSSAAGVYNINDLGKLYNCYPPTKVILLTHVPEKEGIDLEIAIETQKTGW